MKTIRGKIDSLAARLRAAQEAFHNADLAADRADLVSAAEREFALRVELVHERTKVIDAEGAVMNLEFAVMAWARKSGRLPEVCAILDSERLCRKVAPMAEKWKSAFSMGVEVQ